MFSKETRKHIQSYLLQQKLEIENLLNTLKRIHNTSEDSVDKIEYESLLKEYNQKLQNISNDIDFLQYLQKEL